jgi:hypothetical protein
MNARSAKGPSSGPGGDSAPTQFVLDGVATPATPSLSSPVKSVMPLATNLRLAIDLHVEGDNQWLHLSLEDELNLTIAEVNYPVMCTTLDRRYHLREATVIGVRRLLQAAFEKELISDYPGELMTLWNPPSTELPAPTPTLLEDDFTQSWTDLGSL